MLRRRDFKVLLGMYRRSKGIIVKVFSNVEGLSGIIVKSFIWQRGSRLRLIRQERTCWRGIQVEIIAEYQGVFERNIGPLRCRISGVYLFFNPKVILKKYSEIL